MADPGIESLDDRIVKVIEESISGLKYGAVQISVQNGQLVQVERTERRRFETPRTAGGSRVAGAGQNRTGSSIRSGGAADRREVNA